MSVVQVLDDAAREFVNNAFQRQVFKAYVNWFSKVAEHAAWNGLAPRTDRNFQPIFNSVENIQIRRLDHKI
jgi:hypothetical protein